MVYKQRTDTIATTFARPADTTAYAASDVVGPAVAAVQTLSDVAATPGGSGYVTKVRMVKSTSTTTNASFRVYFYTVAPTPIADNAAFTLLWANRANRIGHCDLTLSTEGTGSDSASNTDATIRLPFSCPAGVADLYAVVVAKAAYTPASAEQFYLEIGVERN